MSKFWEEKVELTKKHLDEEFRKENDQVGDDLKLQVDTLCNQLAETIQKFSSKYNGTVRAMIINRAVSWVHVSAVEHMVNEAYSQEMLDGILGDLSGKNKKRTKVKNENNSN